MRKGKKGSSGKDSGLVYQMFANKSTDYSKPTAQAAQPNQTCGNYRVMQLTEQLAQRANDLERLRDYITQLEEGEKGLIQELTRQIATKDEEVSRIAALYAKKEAENRKLSSAFEAHVLSQKEHAERIKALLMRKEQENANNIQTLKKELEKKDSELAAIRQSLMNNPAYVNESQKLKALLDEQNLSKSIQSRMREQMASMSGQIEELKSLILEKETTIQKLELAFERQASEKEDGLRREIEKKNEELAALKKLMLQDKRNSRLAESEADQGPNLRQIEALNKKLADSNEEIKKLERLLIDEQRLNKSVQSRLKEQVASMAGQMEELKSFLIEKEKIIQSLETAFEKRMAAKEEELRHLKEGIIKKPEPHLHKELDSLRAEIHVKEESSRLMAGEIAKLKEQAGILHKRLEERQRIFFESEKAYEQLITQLREQHDARIKALITGSTQKEAALRAELEQEKAKVQRETMTIREKEKQIEETLLAFTKTSEQMLKLGSTALPAEVVSLTSLREEIEAKEEYVNKKESELKALLATTEEKIAELKSREATVERKEQLLMKEQEAISKELDVLNSAGLEITRSKQYLQQKLESVGGEEQATTRQPILPVEATEEQQPLTPKQQTAPQGMFEAAPGVEEAQEDTQIDTPRFSGISSRAPVEEAGVAEEEGLQTIKPEAAKAAKTKGKLMGKAKLKQKQKMKPAKATAARTPKVSKAAPKIVPRPIIKTASKAREPAAAVAADALEKELFSEMGGYSELDEVKSVVEVGLQHGDSVEQIRESLLTSGYSRQNIEKVLSQVKKQ